MFQPKISKEDFARLPIANFTGSIVLSVNPDEAAQAVQAIRDAHTVVGFDTETRPVFVKGQSYKVALVQLSAGSTAYLFRLCLMGGLVEPLKALLEDPNVVKVGLSTHDDFKGLRKWEPELEPGGFIELQHMVKAYGIEEMSLSKIYAILFGRRISKRQQLSNWESPELTPHQQAYAAFDAVACVDIYTALSRLGHDIITRAGV